MIYRPATSLAATVIAATAFVLAACSTAPAHNSLSGPVSPFAPGMVDSEFPANLTEYNAGNLFQSTVQSLENVDIARCLDAHGFHQQVPPVTEREIAAQAYGPDNTDFPDLPRIAASGQFIPPSGLGSGGAFAPVGPKGGGEIPKAEIRDLRSCQQAAARPMLAVTGDLSALSAEWDRITSQVLTMPNMTTAQHRFSSCLQRHGVASANAGSVGSFLGWVTGLQTAAPTKATATAIQRHWAEVFVPCARPLIALQWRLWQGKRKAFLQDHYQEISVAEHRLGPAIVKLERAASVSPAQIGEN
jgi:hypothetical protein